ncbi:unnamed protein product [Darwinula stevensoni]|uniref:EGF-like domain-containing protein n=1 Tax=Darwinula stevensoni TaxID=69355 RepID=A0A7R8X997_9CRUS|nr:unnamed protein product [Darwinula stevensoni]CAG0889469.1 unnamed protein product [Darwinula stevensoni]
MTQARATMSLGSAYVHRAPLVAIARRSVHLVFLDKIVLEYATARTMGNASVSMVGKCICLPGWKGKKCEEPCPEGTFGPDCAMNCTCLNEGVCHADDGKCVCPFGWMGPNCTEGESGSLSLRTLGDVSRLMDSLIFNQLVPRDISGMGAL